MDLPFLWTPSPEVDGVTCAAVEDPIGLAPARLTYYGLQGNDHLQQPLVFERAFSREQCDAIKRYASALPTWKGMSSSSEPGYRACRTAWIEQSDGTAWIFDRLRAVIASANGIYAFRIAGFSEPLHYIFYEPGGRFEWHTDVGDGLTSTRKISVSIQLSEADEYEGGDMEFCPHGPIPEFRGIGNALAFPPYMPHRVSTVTRGTRHALVAWINGAAFA